MDYSRITPADPTLMDGAAKQCGDLATGCSDAAGRVHAVAASIAEQTRILGELQAVMANLETDQRQVTDATDEARLLSDNARTRLKDGMEIIAGSVAELSELAKLVARVGGQITNFASAMDQVRRTTATIDGIARTTKMLALNAAIEAEKAGAAGKTFAVVAAEVKQLAQDTRAATDEIGVTVDSLTAEGDLFVQELQQGMVRSRAAEANFGRILDTCNVVIEVFDQVDRQNDDIARSTSAIHDSVCRVGEELSGFAEAAKANATRLDTAFSQMRTLENSANAMFNSIVQSGFATDDRHFVDVALDEAQRFVAMTEAALRTRDLTRDALFDFSYTPIAGSNPPRFDTRLNDFADAVWRPELDRVVASEPRLISCACTDKNGYLPTHTTMYSRPPKGDPIYDAAHCRNRRILLDDSDKIAKASTKPFHVAVYRRENDDGSFHVVRNVYVPMVIGGKRWGDFEVAYRVD